MEPWLYLITFSVLVTYAKGLPEVIKIAGIFDTENGELEDIFRYAVASINKDTRILPNSKLQIRVEKLKPNDSYHASKTVCKLVEEEGIAAIFGPFTTSSLSIVEATCSAMNFPHLEAMWKYKNISGDRSLNLHPDSSLLTEAYFDLVNSKNWKRFTVIYETNEDLIRLRGILNVTSERDKTPTRITLRQLRPGQSYKKLIKDVGKTDETNIVLSIPADKIVQVLKDANDVRMLTEYHNYLVTDLDFHTIQMGKLGGIVSNITGFRLVDYERPDAVKILSDSEFAELRYRMKNAEKQHIKTIPALLFDAVKLFATALHDLDRRQTIHIKPANCSVDIPWFHSNSIVNFMRTITIEGLTGILAFNNDGTRKHFELDIIKAKKDGFRKIGSWNPIDRINVTETDINAEDFDEDYRRGHGGERKVLRITTIVTAPYTMVRPDKNLTGNDRFEGFNLDLMSHIAKRLDMDYQFELVRDGNYGNPDDYGEWNGMMKEVISREADLAFADLTITSKRAEAVDFTMPFMNLGISIMFKKPKKENPNLFSFLLPFSLDVWLYMATAYLGVSLIIFILARFTPYEWVNPHPCEEEAEEYENQFNLPNSLWFTIGALMQQGSDLAPRAVTTRMLGLVWYFFTLIMIATYTANLAAFLTAQRMAAPIENANDLARQSKIQYGCVASGSTKMFFKENKNEPFKRMWSTMESTHPTVFVENNEKGIERVRKGNYAFLMESTTIEYRTERICDLVQIGGLLDNKGYGIATPIGSPYRVRLSSAIVGLLENGTLHKLKEKWWKGQGGGLCSDDTKGDSTSELGIKNVGGVFVVLIAGLALGICVVIGEFVWKTHKVPRELRDNMCSEFMKELKFIICYRGSTRPIPKSESASMSESLKMLPLNQVNRKPDSQSR